MYVIAPYDKVKGPNSMPEYADVLKALQDAAIRRAEDIWQGYTFGGLYPGENEFGICPLRPLEMTTATTSTALSGTYSFKKNIGSTGWRNMFNYSVRKDVIHALAGFAVTDEVLRLVELRMELGDKKYPIMNIEEAKGWGRFAIILKEDQGEELVIQEEKSVLVKAYADATGYQTFIPLGFQLYKRKDLVITET